MIMLFLIFVFMQHENAICGPSQRGKCTLECYSRCMQSGTPSALYCNCPVERASRPCSSIESKLLRAEVVSMAPSVSSEYIDAHSIRIQMPDYPGAFTYVFEYSTISALPDEWYFAGASTTPTITFTILDHCSDYKFRVIVVIRSTNPDDQFVVYRPTAIPLQLPPFALNPEQISVETPIFNSSTEMLKIYVRWTLPRGYSDSDIYGYESPALYPLQCRTPEDELPYPKIEIVRAGGRLVVLLPLSVLEARCRLWVEVTMLPRCVRLEPFSIQKNIEIDCEKNPDLEICSKDANPVCTDIIDVWGERGKATIMWQPPSGKVPLYYHVRYGPAQMKGVVPFVSWQLATRKDVKVDSMVSSLTLNVAEDQDFGVQVCAILTKQRKKPKFGIVRVTPFHCTSCKNIPTHSEGRCGECGKIEGTTVSERSWKAGARPHTNGVTRKEDIDSLKSRVILVPSQTVFRMETDLIVSGNSKQSLTNISMAQVNTHSTDAPISIERAEEINKIVKNATDFNEQDKTSTESIKTERITSTGQSFPSTEHTTTTVVVMSDMSSPIPEEKTTMNSVVRIVEVGADLSYARENSKRRNNGKLYQKEGGSSYQSKISSERKNSIDNDNIKDINGQNIIDGDIKQRMHLNTLENPDEVQTNFHEESKKLMLELEESVKNLEKVLTNQQHSKKSHEDESTSLPFSDDNSKSEINNKYLDSGRQIENVKNKSKNESTTLVLGTLNEKSPSIRTTPLIHRIHEKSKKCLLSSGIVCEFGCETRKLCRCPVISHILSSEGTCLRKDLIRHTVCLPKRDINATWDPITMNIMVRSVEAGEHISSVEGADRLFIEFGKVREERVALSSSNLTLGGFVFSEKQRNKMVVGMERLIRSEIFSREPFIFHINHSIDIDDAMYGMRLCTFNSTQIKDPYEHDWDIDGMSNQSSNIIQVVQLSPVYFTNDLHSDYVHRNSKGSFWNIFLVIGKISVLIVLLLIMCVLLYLNCARIKTFYDRKRTHYFRPYYLDPQVHMTSINRYAPSSSNSPQRTDSTVVGYYDTRSRMI